MYPQQYPGYTYPSAGFQPKTGFPTMDIQQFAILGDVIQYGMMEAQRTGYPHVLREVAIISYLMGKGYDFASARRVAESLEVNESYPMF